MLRNYFLFSCFLLCFISGADNKDLIDGLNLKNSKYYFVKPQVVHRWARDSNRQSQLKESEEETISYAINIGQRKHFLHLHKNRGFLHPNLDISGNHKSTHPKNHHDHCYYHGEVEGYENSMVALSTCSGLRGVIIFGNETYGLEPVPGSAANEHLLYQLRDMNPENVTCGVVSEATGAQRRQSFEPGQSLISLLRRKRNLPQTSYVELALVADNLRYKYKKENETAVREEMVEMANLLDGYYKPLNIRVVLVGLEVFKDSNPFIVDGSAREVLSEFVKWRKSTLLPKVRHDVGQLIVGRPQAYDGNVLGMAFVGTVCSVSSSGGINVFGNDNLVSASTIVAHEMGHNLGMGHDSLLCCETKSCIMAPAASSSTSFSSCSAEDFEALVLRGGGVCLKNQPSPSDVVSTAKCGNGLLEDGEECDCGTPQECKTKCCDAATCKLTSGSSCAEGSCCDNCQIKVAGTQCRGSADSCDLPEYCNGQTEFCPDDFYVMDGLPCENDAAYCYEGRCQTYDYQCKHLFAPDPAKKAADECFLFANVQGNKFGNCGITSRGTYIKCNVADAMCGKVQCSNVDVNHPPPGAHVSIQVVNGSKCVNADFNLGTDVLDPAYVNPGSPCAKGKTCLDFKCVDAAALKSRDCDAQTTCNGNGKCNDQGHCHCQNGWAPPKCDRSGRGGSVESGPAQIDYSLRNGLLIFFLLVVPLLVLVLVLIYIFKRDTVDSWLRGGRRRRSRNTQHGNEQSNSNVHAHTATQLPAHVSHEAEYPPATSAPISGFRYGELDYWKTEATTAPARPPPPTQGPGVPRPIPPRQLPV